MVIIIILAESAETECKHRTVKTETSHWLGTFGVLQTKRLITHSYWFIFLTEL